MLLGNRSLLNAFSINSSSSFSISSLALPSCSQSHFRRREAWKVGFFSEKVGFFPLFSGTAGYFGIGIALKAWSLGVLVALEVGTAEKFGALWIKESIVSLVAKRADFYPTEPLLVELRH